MPVSANSSTQPNPDGEISRVTIGICCFNAEDTIARAIQSAISQEWKNLEIIIVDDCSTDNSVAVITKEISHIPEASLQRHSINKGVASTRNTVLENATGEFIAFFDDDDESYSNRIKQQVATLQNYRNETGEEHVACYCSGERHYPNGYVKHFDAIGSKEIKPNGAGVADYLLLYKKRPGWFYGAGVPSCALMARRTTFMLVNGFDSELRRVEDADFAIRLGMAGGHFVGTSEKLFTQFATDAEDKAPEKNLEAEQYIAKKNKAYLQSIGYYQYALRWPKLRYLHFRRQYIKFIIEFSILLLRHPLKASSHLLKTGPLRFLHEYRMRRETGQ